MVRSHLNGYMDYHTMLPHYEPPLVAIVPIFRSSPPPPLAHSPFPPPWTHSPSSASREGVLIKL